MVLVKHIISTVKMTTWDRVYYSNLLTIPLLCIPFFLFEEYAEFKAFKWTKMSVFLLLLGSILGIAMSFTTYRIRELLSATAFSVLGVCNKAISEAINVLIWSLHSNTLGVFGLFVSVIGAFFFARERKKDKEV